MKWLKHFSNMSESDDGAFLLHKYGLPGYARWCLILEKIALFMDESTKCYRELPIQEWCDYLMTTKERLIQYLTDIQQRLNVHWTYTEPMLKIEVPKMVELRDETTRKKQNRKSKSGVIQEQDKEIEVDKDLEVDKDRNNNLVKLKLKDTGSNKKNIELVEQISKVYEFYKVLFDRPKYQLTEKRKKKLQSRLVESAIGVIPWANNRFLELLIAITEVSLTEFNMGKNDQQKTYIELDEHCCRNQEQVEQRLNQATERNNLEKIKRYLIKEGYLNEKITS